MVAGWPLVFPPPSAVRPPAWRLLAGPSVGPAGRPSDTGGIAVCPSLGLAVRPSAWPAVWRTVSLGGRSFGRRPRARARRSAASVVPCSAGVRLPARPSGDPSARPSGLLSVCLSGGRPVRPARPSGGPSARPSGLPSVCLSGGRPVRPSFLPAGPPVVRSARPSVVWLPSVLPTGRRSVRPSARPRPRLPGRRLACVRSWVVGLSVG